MAREVHDSLTQLAHAAAMHLDNAVDLLDGSAAPARAAVERMLQVKLPEQRAAA